MLVSLKDFAEELKERGVINEQSLSRLYITGYEWLDFCSEEDFITSFVENGVISKPDNDFDTEKLIESIVEEHKLEYVKFVTDLMISDDEYTYTE